MPWLLLIYFLGVICRKISWWILKVKFRSDMRMVAWVLVTDDMKSHFFSKPLEQSFSIAALLVFGAGYFFLVGSYLLHCRMFSGIPGIYPAAFPPLLSDIVTTKDVLIAQLCLTLCDTSDCSPPGSSVHGIPQARILEWAAISSSRQSSQPRNWTCVFLHCRRIPDPLSHQGSPQNVSRRC